MIAIEQFLNYAALGVVILNKDETVTYLNPMAARLFNSDAVNIKQHPTFTEFLQKAQRYALIALNQQTVEIIAIPTHFEQEAYTLLLFNTCTDGGPIDAIFSKSETSMEEFIYCITHDLNEQIHLIASYIELLNIRYQGKLDEKADRFITHALQCVNRLHAMIKGLLNYSQLSMGEYPISTVNTQELYSELLKQFSQKIKSTGARITATGLPVLNTSRELLLRLLCELVDNALCFRSKQSPVIQLSAVEKDKTWVFSVKDNGIGIDPQYHSRIFNIFQKLHSPMEHQGMGMGLAVCKKITTILQGKIWVESRIDSHSTFHFSIPKK